MIIPIFKEPAKKGVRSQDRPGETDELHNRRVVPEREALEAGGGPFGPHRSRRAERLELAAQQEEPVEGVAASEGTVHPVRAHVPVFRALHTERVFGQFGARHDTQVGSLNLFFFINFTKLIAGINFGP